MITHLPTLPTGRQAQAGIPKKITQICQTFELLQKSQKELDKKTRSLLCLKSIDEVHPVRNGASFPRPFYRERKKIYLIPAMDGVMFSNGVKGGFDEKRGSSYRCGPE